MFPVFSMVLDKDVEPDIAMTYPELYKELTKVLCCVDIYSAISVHRCFLIIIHNS